eukprot:symbB.v1.2.017191.t1/scaffold1335.1/size146336/2
MPPKGKLALSKGKNALAKSKAAALAKSKANKAAALAKSKANKGAALAKSKAAKAKSKKQSPKALPKGKSKSKRKQKEGEESEEEEEEEQALPKSSKKKRKLTKKRLAKLGHMSLREKVEKVVEESPTLEEAAVTLKENLEKGEHSKIWSRHQTHLKSNPQEAKAHEEMGKKEKGLASVLWFVTTQANKGIRKSGKVEEEEEKKEKEEKSEAEQMADAIRKAQRCKEQLVVGVSNMEEAIHAATKAGRLTSKTRKEHELLVKDGTVWVEKLKVLVARKGESKTLEEVKEQLAKAAAKVKEMKDEAKELQQAANKAMSKASTKK